MRIAMVRPFFSGLLPDEGARQRLAARSVFQRATPSGCLK